MPLPEWPERVEVILGLAQVPRVTTCTNHTTPPCETMSTPPAIALNAEPRIGENRESICALDTAEADIGSGQGQSVEHGPAGFK